MVSNMAYDGLFASLMFAYNNRLAIPQVLIFSLDMIYLNCFTKLSHFTFLKRCARRNNDNMVFEEELVGSETNLRKKVTRKAFQI